MKRITSGIILMWIGIFIFTTRLCLFGWNIQPINKTDAYLLLTQVTLIFLGISSFLWPLVDLYKSAVKRDEKQKEQQSNEDFRIQLQKQIQKQCEDSE